MTGVGAPVRIAGPINQSADYTRDKSSSRHPTSRRHLPPDGNLPAIKAIIGERSVRRGSDHAAHDLDVDVRSAAPHVLVGEPAPWYATLISALSRHELEDDRTRLLTWPSEITWRLSRRYARRPHAATERTP